MTCFFKTAFSSPVCSLYILRPLLPASWNQHDDLSILHFWTFPKDLETMIGTLSLVESWIAFSFAVHSAWIILFLFFIHLKTLVLSRLKLLQIFINSAVVALSSFFWIISVMNRASCFIRFRLIFGSLDVKSIVGLDVEPSFNELVEEVEGSQDEDTVVET